MWPTAYYGAPNFDSTVRAFNRADQMTFKGDHEFTRWWKASRVLSALRQPGAQQPLVPQSDRVAEPGRDLPQGGRDPGELHFHADADHGDHARATASTASRISLRPSASASTSRRSACPPRWPPSRRYPAFPAITMGDLTSYGGGTTTQNVYHSKSFNATVVEVHGQAQPQGRLRLPPAASRWRARHRAEQLQLQRRVHPRHAARPPPPAPAPASPPCCSAYPTGGSMTVGTNFYNYVRYYGIFVQDDFRITSQADAELRLPHRA